MRKYKPSVPKMKDPQSQYQSSITEPELELELQHKCNPLPLSSAKYYYDQYYKESLDESISAINDIIKESASNGKNKVNIAIQKLNKNKINYLVKLFQKSGYVVEFKKDKYFYSGMLKIEF